MEVLKVRPGIMCTKRDFHRFLEPNQNRKKEPKNQEKKRRINNPPPAFKSDQMSSISQPVTPLLEKVRIKTQNTRPLFLVARRDRVEHVKT
jgi:hypothetical protein